MEPKARRDQLLIQKIGDELVIYDRQRDRVHRLNQAAALVWRHCDGKTRPAEMADLLARELGLPADEEVVRLALTRLTKARLMQAECWVEGRPVTRRAVVRKLGLAGAMTLLLPVVISITAPTPAAAQSATVVCGLYINGQCVQTQPCPSGQSCQSYTGGVCYCS